MPNMFRLAYDVKMSAEATDTAEVMLYGEIIEDGPKWWKWSEEEKSAKEFDKEIKKAKEDGAKKLLLRINSPGGVCTEAVAMRGILLTAGFEEINIRIEGMCASAATDLATLPNAHVSIFEGAEYMIHNPWTYAFGNANDMEKVIDRLRNIEQTSRNFYMQKTGQTEDQIKTWMDNETWFTAEQAVEYGFADELIKAEVEAPIAACVTNRAFETMKNLYRAVPEQITVQDPEDPANTVSNPEGAENIKQEEETMVDMTKFTPEELAEIRESAITEERERVDAITALTMPGCEQLAEEAKKNGTSAIDFQKQVVEHMKKNGSNFMQQRKEETTPAQKVAGSAPSTENEETMIQQNAKDVAEYAATFAKSAAGNMF